MNISFWNTQKNKKINEMLIPLIIERKIDIMILAEYEDNIEQLISDLYVKGENYVEGRPIACKKIKLLYKKNISIELNNDSSSYVATTIVKNAFSFTLVSVHFPSKLYTSDDNREIVARTLRSDVEQYDKVLVIGDFNSNPFEKTMAAYSGLLALPTKTIKKRKVQGEEKKILYNPMWTFLGDFESIPGTYFYNSSDDINYYWNIFDQVLLSNELLRFFDSSSLEIIKKISDISLIKGNKIHKEISDHLPIILTLKEVANGKCMEKEI